MNADDLETFAKVGANTQSVGLSMARICLSLPEPPSQIHRVISPGLKADIVQLPSNIQKHLEESRAVVQADPRS